jgi:methylated-DNA-[protein]-cysteine S-methyltransferase
VAAANGFCIFDTPIGACGLAWGEGGVAGAQLPERDEEHTRARMQRRFPGVAESEPPVAMQELITRIRDLLNGSIDQLLDVALDMNDVPEFNQRVYAITRAIAPGRTLTYGEIARELGDVALSRAVGQALGHNPFAPIVPCHRVLAAGSASGGFSADGGVATKLKMLQIEKAQLGPQPGLFD